MGIPKDKLTEEQKKQIEQLRQFVARNHLDARMNGTRWRAAIDAVAGVEGYDASFRVKLVTDPTDPPLGKWDRDFPGKIPLYNSIEWLELNPHAEVPQGSVGMGSGEGNRGRGDRGNKSRRPDFCEALKRKLSNAKIPIVETSTGIRIIGYVRRGF